MYTVRFSKKAEKALKRLNPVMRRRVLGKMKYLEDNPFNGPNIKSMKGFPNRHRYRVGDLRVVYEIIGQELVVWVLDLDWRGNLLEYYSGD